VSVSFDANILVYSGGPLDEPKCNRARMIIGRGMRSGASVLLLQALAEYSNVTIRKSGLPASAVLKVIAGWRGSSEIHAAAEPDLQDALDVVARHRLPFWDAMLWATARRVGVRHLLTEDFQDGRELDGVSFVNPFKPANDALIDRILAG
jgi:predicted nucleic acid-binding protein